MQLGMYFTYKKKINVYIEKKFNLSYRYSIH